MMQLDNLYQEVILDHYKNPQNKVLDPNSDSQVHHVNPSCGDEITLGVILDGNKVSSITWEGVGCSISQASTSIASDLLTGKTLEEARSISDDFLQLIFCLERCHNRAGALLFLGWRSFRHDDDDR
jgi:nitrogen fixation NifU-like protein